MNKVMKVGFHFKRIKEGSSKQNGNVLFLAGPIQSSLKLTDLPSATTRISAASLQEII